MSLKPIDIAMGVAVALTWGMGVVFAKAAIEHFPPILLMSFRFAVTALVMIWFVRPPFGDLASICAIAFVVAAIQYSLTFTGLTGVDASVAALVVQLEVPFLVLLGALLLKERPSLRKWLGILMAFIGVALIAGEPKVGSAWPCLLMVVGGALVWAVGQIMVRRLRRVEGLAMTAWIAVFAAPQLLVMSLVFEDNQLAAIREADWIVWSTVLYLGVVMTAFGYGMWYTLVHRHPVSHVAPFLLLLPVFSVLGGVGLLGEQLTTHILLGGAIVLGGVAFILFERPAVAATLPGDGR